MIQILGNKIFFFQTYFGMDVRSVSDPLKRQALLTMIRTYGQTPKQLFTSPHAPCELSQVSQPFEDRRTYLVSLTDVSPVQRYT
jgi:hypothetical protein